MTEASDRETSNQPPERTHPWLKLGGNVSGKLEDVSEACQDFTGLTLMFVSSRNWDGEFRTKTRPGYEWDG